MLCNVLTLLERRAGLGKRDDSGLRPAQKVSYQPAPAWLAAEPALAGPNGSAVGQRAPTLYQVLEDRLAEVPDSSATML